MTVITISRELGSEGSTIAQRVAAEMGYRLVTKTTFEKVLHQYGLIQLDELYTSVPSLWARIDITNLELVSRLDKIILGFARLDKVVLLGRGGYAALNEYADVLNVRIQAPFQARVKRVLEKEGMDNLAQAEKMVLKNDKARAVFVQGFYGVDFYDTRQFQLVLDTEVIPVDTAVAWIVESAQLMENRSFAGAKTTQEIVVGPVLKDAIDQVLMMPV